MMWDRDKKINGWWRASIRVLKKYLLDGHMVAKQLRPVGLLKKILSWALESTEGLKYPGLGIVPETVRKDCEIPEENYRNGVSAFKKYIEGTCPLTPF